MTPTPKPETIERETPITLGEACAIFRGNLTPATLWAEQKRGRLVIFKIGRRYYTTRNDVELMVSKCRDEAKAPGSISTRIVERGQSETDRAQSAQAALSASVIRLRKSSRNI
jgi:hypothetical protein